MDKEKRFAVLIDAENVSNKYIKLIMDELSTYGIATYKRLYGDYTQASVNAWIPSLKEYAITPIFQCNYTSNKNASDTALIIDAMDILYSENVNGFCLVSSDSDYTKLAMRLRESGMTVIGMGEKKTPNSLVAACEEFKFLDLLYSANNKAGDSADANSNEAVPAEKDVSNIESVNNIPSLGDIEKEIISIIKSKTEADEWLDLSEVGITLSKRVPGFDPRNYQCEKLKQLIIRFKSIELKETPNPNKKLLKIIYVREKQ